MKTFGHEPLDVPLEMRELAARMNWHVIQVYLADGETKDVKRMLAVCPFVPRAKDEIVVDKGYSCVVETVVFELERIDGVAVLQPHVCAVRKV